MSISSFASSTISLILDRRTTGCGLPAGPGGALGALEGVSYLWVVGLLAYSLYTKVKTGKGLPPGERELVAAR